MSASPSAEPSAKEDGPLTVLLAEDDPVSQRMAVLLLERLGCRCDVVGNGEEALQSLATRPYDVVLMAVQMPVMDGLEATRRLRAQLPAEHQPRVVAMTASALAEDRAACLTAGMDDCLAKPVRRDELAAALSRAAPVQGAPGTEPGEAAVDLEVLQSLLARLGDRGPAMLDRLLDSWESENARRLGELDAAVAADDPAAAARAAHALRGGSASMGAVRLAAVCGALEDAVRAGGPVDLAAARDEVAATVEQARAGLGQLRLGSGG